MGFELHTFIELVFLLNIEYDDIDHLYKYCITKNFIRNYVKHELQQTTYLYENK